jgi:hypothetical protein
MSKRLLTLCSGVVLTVLPAGLLAETVPPVGFSPTQDPMVGTEPYSSTVGDFNGDGILDVLLLTTPASRSACYSAKAMGRFKRRSRCRSGCRLPEL